MWHQHDPVKIRRDMGEDQGKDILAPKVDERHDGCGDDRGSSWLPPPHRHVSETERDHGNDTR